MLKYRFLFIYTVVGGLSLLAAIVLGYILESHLLWLLLFSVFFIGCFTISILFINRFKKDYISDTLEQKKNYHNLTQQLTNLQGAIISLTQKPDDTKLYAQNLKQQFEDLNTLFANSIDKIAQDIALQSKKQAELDLYIRNEGFKQIQNTVTSLQKTIVKEHDQTVEQFNESAHKQLSYLQSISEETRNLEFALSQEIGSLSKQLETVISTTQDNSNDLTAQIDKQEIKITKQLLSFVEQITAEQQTQLLKISNIFNTVEILQEQSYKQFDDLLITIKSYKIAEAFAQLDRQQLTNEILLNKVSSKIELVESQNQRESTDIANIKQQLETTIANNLQLLQDINYKNALELAKLESELSKCVQQNTLLLNMRSELETGLKAVIITQSSEGISSISKLIDLQINNLNQKITNTHSSINLQNIAIEKAQTQSTESLKNEILKLAEHITVTYQSGQLIEQNLHITILQHIDQLCSTTKQNLETLKTDIKQNIINHIENLTSNASAVSEQIVQLHTSVTSQTEIQKSNTAEILKYNKDVFNSLVRRINISTNQVEAFVCLYSTIKPNLPLPQMRGWAISPDVANKLISYLLHYKPKTILNIGSGLSDIVLSYAIKRHNLNTKIISLEADLNFLEITKSNLELHQLSGIVELVHAPLVPHKIDDKEWLWYDISRLSNICIDMLFVDGPPSTTQKLARYPAFPLLKNHLASNPIIILDDAIRQEEKDIAKLWITENPEFTSEYFEDEKGTIVLKKLKNIEE